jgi:hypothetical protein
MLCALQKIKITVPFPSCSGKYGVSALRSRPNSTIDMLLIGDVHDTASTTSLPRLLFLRPWTTFLDTASTTQQQRSPSIMGLLAFDHNL